MIDKYPQKDKKLIAKLKFPDYRSCHLEENLVDLTKFLCNNNPKFCSKLEQDVHTISFNGSYYGHYQIDTINGLT